MARARWLMMIVPFLVLPACEDDEEPSLGESAVTTVTSSEITTTTAAPTTPQPAPQERGQRYRGALLRRTDSGMTINGRALPGVTQLSGGLIEGDPPNFVLDVVRDDSGEMVWFGMFEGERSGDDPRRRGSWTLSTSLLTQPTNTCKLSSAALAAR